MSTIKNKHIIIFAIFILITIIVLNINTCKEKFQAYLESPVNSYVYQPQRHFLPLDVNMFSSETAHFDKQINTDSGRFRNESGNSVDSGDNFSAKIAPPSIANSPVAFRNRPSSTGDTMLYKHNLIPQMTAVSSSFNNSEDIYRTAKWESQHKDSLIKPC
jgi:hypothetical protein